MTLGRYSVADPVILDQGEGPLRTNSKGELIVAGTSSTEYTEDAVAAANPSGGMMMAVRRDTLTATEVSADGDNVALKATSKGELATKDTDVAALVGPVTAVAWAAGDSTMMSLLKTLGTAALDVTTESPVAARRASDVIAVTPTLDTLIYAAGDTLFDRTAIAACVRANDKHAMLKSVCLIDKDDQKPQVKLFFFSGNNVFGTVNAAPSISDANAGEYLGSVTIVTADWEDLGGVSVACLKNIDLVLEPATGTQIVYVAGLLTAGTPTHTAAGLVLRFGVEFLD